MASPNWTELLLSIEDFPSAMDKQPLSAEQVERLKSIANASSSYSGILNSGISAIGWSIAASADNEDFGIDANEVRNLGWLMQALGRLSHHLSHLHGEAVHRLQHCPRAENEENQP
ncbi:hypothetical protein I5L51_17995 [Pseudomonas mendocina]|nr:hypothetical protein [Pseudomonas mendocina]MBH3341007.1 hypothetical protein [Pseudomonas mendocina]